MCFVLALLMMYVEGGPLQSSLSYLIISAERTA